ncbi:MAG: response regulator [Planctomycetes bacterium]|nr:response regulator [Planctomycetota bacterium]
MEGSFMLRDKVLTLVDLGQYLNMAGEETSKGEGLIVIVDFNNIHCGILVDSVERIHRLSWSHIDQPPSYLMNLNTPVTGTVNIEEKTVLVIDFETILSDIFGVQGSSKCQTNENSPVDQKDIHILFAEDSSFMRKNVVGVLNRGGYTNITVCSDGAQAWEKIQEMKGRKENPCDLVLTDIEMPRMDGLHLTSNIKADQELKDIPVVLFSSLITDDNRKKGESVGADAQVCKPDSEGIIKVVEQCLQKTHSQRNNRELVNS